MFWAWMGRRFMWCCCHSHAPQSTPSTAARILHFYWMDVWAAYINDVFVASSFLFCMCSLLLCGRTAATLFFFFFHSCVCMCVFVSVSVYACRQDELVTSHCLYPDHSKIAKELFSYANCWIIYYYSFCETDALTHKRDRERGREENDM